MKKQLAKISIRQTSKIFAILYFVLAAIIAIPLGIYTLIVEPDKAKAIGIFIVPLVYLVIIYVATAVGSWFYNLIAKSFGGIEFTLNDTDKTE